MQSEFWLKHLYIKHTFGLLRRIWKDNVKMDIREVDGSG
jgi:hypothetical protein